ncbi:histidine kinase [Thioclava dalianensis]|uniref:histidine kinase n=1 Tax=Thioclava dalianensis TaxID=1185766 RepID=A0A074U741_9RHOB|nr:HWE histidine kinase domain-containing protein [Thioclava dalianensis]KEP70497.1 histidine kinase [Thioclava dalianensis]SFN08793.1 Two-component sensor histidine kinase, contains HisKA and HATPase domains [Thioclava dalianensis]
MLPKEGQDVSPLDDPARLRALQQTGLLDTPAQEAFDRATRLASRIVGAPVSLITLVEPTRQFLLSRTGAAAEALAVPETPISDSFCRHVVENDAELIVEDARTDPRVQGNGAIEGLGVIAYLGVPLRTEEGDVLGSFCVIGHEPRKWTEIELETLKDLALGVESEIRLRRRTNIATQERETFRAILDQMPMGILLSEIGDDATLNMNRAARDMMGPPAHAPDANSRHGVTICDPQGAAYRPDDLPINRAARDGETVSSEEIVVHHPQRAPHNLLVSARRIETEPPLAVATLLDVTTHRAAERAAALSHARLAHFHDITRDGILEIDATDRVRYGNAVIRARLRDAYGEDRAEAMEGVNLARECPEFLGPEFEPVLAQARASGQPQTTDLTGHDGHTLEARLFPDEDAVLVYLRNVTEERAVAQARDTLARELNHRVKNLFAMMSGLIGMTARHAKTPAAMASGLRARINALARAHDLVSPTATLESAFRGKMDFATLIHAILEPYVAADDPRLSLEGPTVLLNQSGTTNFALVLHELVTNAVKYGALGHPGARLALQWDVTEGKDGAELHFTWKESDCPPRGDQPRGTGFGNSLIDLTIRAQLRGSYGTEWPSDGFISHMTAPMELIKG